MIEFICRSFLCSMLIISALFSHASIASPYTLSKTKESVIFASAGLLAAVGLWGEYNKASPSAQSLANLDRANVPNFDRYNVGKWNKTAQRISDAVLFGSILTPSIHLYNSKQDFWTLGFMYAETFVLTAGGISAVKGHVTRYRPFTYGDLAPLEAKLDNDATRSFFSGHAAMISSTLIFSATVFSDYYPQSSYSTLVWTGALSGIALGSWMRIEGGKHFISDIVCGILWGASVGYAIPRSHRKDKNTVAILPFYQQGSLGLSWVSRF